MTSLNLLNANSFDQVYTTDLYTDTINVNDASEIDVQSIMNFSTLPKLNGTGIQQYIREQLTVTGALDYNTTTGLLTGISIDNYNRDVVLSLSGPTVLSADLASGTGQSLVLYMNYSQTVGSNKALELEPSGAAQTILGTVIPGNTTQLITTFEILETTLNQTFVPSGIFDINLFCSESNANDGLEVYTELYIWDGVAETLIATTDTIEVVSEYPDFSEATMSATNTIQRVFDVGYSFRMKIYGVNNRGSSHTLYTYYEGTGSSYSHIHTPFNQNLAGGYWSKNGTSIYLTATGNNVAIGGFTANAKLDVYGDILTQSIYGLNASFNDGTFNNLNALSISGDYIRSLAITGDILFGTNGSIVNLTGTNLDYQSVLGRGSATFLGEVLVGSGNSSSIFVGGRTTIGDNGIRIHVPLGSNINNFIDTKQPAGGALIFRLDTTFGSAERMRLSQTGLSIGSTNMNARLVVGGNVLINNNAPVSTASGQGNYIEWSRGSFDNPVSGAGSFGSKGISNYMNQRGSGSGGMSWGEVDTSNNYTANAFLAPTGDYFLRGALIASGGTSQVNAINISGGARFRSDILADTMATFNNIYANNATFTNLGLSTLSISDLELNTLRVQQSATFNQFFATFTNGVSATFTGDIIANNYKAEHWSGTTTNSPAGSTYFKLATLPTTSDGGNGGAIRIQGTIGGWLRDRIGTIDIHIVSRGGIAVGGSLYTSGNVSALTNITTYADIIIYQETGGTFTIYLHSKGLFAFYDFIVSCPSGVSNMSVFSPSSAVSPTGSVNTASVLSAINYVGIGNNFDIDGQYSINGATFNAVAPMVYNPTLNSVSMPQVDDVGTDGYLSSAQYDALADASVLWTNDTGNTLLRPTTNAYNIQTLNTDLAGTPTVRDVGMRWRRTTLSGSLDHYLRMRTGGVKDGYLIHENTNSTPLQLCAGAVQPAVLIGGNFSTGQIDANTVLQLEQSQNGTPTIVKFKHTGVAGSNNYNELIFENNTSQYGLRTGGSSDRFQVIDRTRNAERFAVSPSQLVHNGQIATLCQTGAYRMDVINTASGTIVVDFNTLSATFANDFDVRFEMAGGSVAGLGRGNMNLWANQVQFVAPNGSGNRTRVDSNANMSINAVPAGANYALTMSGNCRLTNNGVIEFNDGNVEILRNGNAMEFQTNNITRFQISQNGFIGIGTNAIDNSVPFIAGFDGSSGIDIINAFQENNSGTTGKFCGFGFHHNNTQTTRVKTGAIRTYTLDTTANQSRMTFAVNQGGTLTERVFLSNTGNLGIGTSTPSQALEVSGTAYIQSVVGGTYDAIRVANQSQLNSTAKDLHIRWYGTDTVGTQKDIGAIRYSPNEADWLNSITHIYGRRGDVSNFETVKITHSNQEVIICPNGTAFTNPSLFLNGITRLGEPGVRFHYAGGSGGFFDLRGGTSAHKWHFRGDVSSGGTTLATIDFNGDFTATRFLSFGALDTGGSTLLYGNGSNRISTFSSDRKTKEEIEPLQLEEVEEIWKTLDPVKYFFKDGSNPKTKNGNKRKYYGLIANDIHENLQITIENVRVNCCEKCRMESQHNKDCCCKEYDELECMCDDTCIGSIQNYLDRELIPILISKVKQQEKQIQQLEKDVIQLKYQMATLINKLEVQGIRTK